MVVEAFFLKRLPFCEAHMRRIKSNHRNPRVHALAIFSTTVQLFDAVVRIRLNFSSLDYSSNQCLRRQFSWAGACGAGFGPYHIFHDTPDVATPIRGVVRRYHHAMIKSP